MGVKAIALGAEQTYILYFKSQEQFLAAAKTWGALVDNITSSNVTLFTQMYRILFNVPEDADLDTERKLICERFGDMPVNNVEFIEVLDIVKDKYEKNKQDYPVFVEWLSDNFDCHYEPVVGMFHFEK